MIRGSFFANAMSNEPLEFADDPEAFEAELLEWFGIERPATDDEKKFNTPLITPAVYKPGTTRANSNVDFFGGWYCADVDNGVPMDEAAELLTAYNVRSWLASTTKSKFDAERYRAFYLLDRYVDVADARKLWAGTNAWLGGMSDRQTKDATRIFNVPAHWIGSDPRFISIPGAPACADEILSLAPEEEVGPTWTPSDLEMKRARKVLAGSGKTLPDHETIMNSRVVDSRFVDEYLATPKGEHHVALYTFMCKVAGRAYALGYAVSPYDLITFAKQVDAICLVKTNSARWSRIKSEADRALRWASDQFQQQ